MAISILHIALEKGVTKDERGSITMGEFDRLDLPFFSGCQICGASLAPYNAYPSKTGFIRCIDCIGDFGFETVRQFDTFIR